MCMATTPPLDDFRLVLVDLGLAVASSSSIESRVNDGVCVVVRVSRFDAAGIAVQVVKEEDGRSFSAHSCLVQFFSIVAFDASVGCG